MDYPVLLWISMLSVLVTAGLSDEDCHVRVGELEMSSLHMDKFTGVWYHVVYQEGPTSPPALTSGYFEFIPTSGCEIEIQYGGERDLDCVGPLIVKGRLKGQRIVVTSEIQGHLLNAGHTWLISTDYNEYTMLYTCSTDDDIESCDPDHVIIHLLGRRSYLNETSLLNYYNLTERNFCAKDRSLYKKIKHNTRCFQEESLRRASKKQPDDFLIKVPEVQRFNMKEFVGDWFYLATSNTKDVATSSAHDYMELVDDDTLRTYYSYLGSKERCLPSINGTLRRYRNHKATFRIDFRANQGLMRVIYVTESYEYALIYVCVKENDDWPCTDASVELIGRTTMFPDDLWPSLSEVIADLCVDPDKMYRLNHEVYCQAIPEQTNCRVDAVKADSDIAWNEMVGQWHLKAAANSLFDNRQVSAYFSLLPTGDVAVNLAVTRNGECQPPISGTFSLQDDGSMVVTGLFGKVKGISKIVYTDYNTALQYQCDYVLDDGQCQGRSTMVLLWQRPTQIDVGTTRFTSKLEQLCIKRHALNPIRHQADCDVKPFCKVTDIKAQIRFDMNMLAGEWHSILMQNNIRDVTHAHYLLRPNQDGGFTVYSALVRNGTCGETFRSSSLLPVEGRHGEFKVSYGRFQGLLKVVYLSQNYALLYECDKERADGSCEPKQERLEMLARPHVEIGQAFLRGAGPILQLVCRTPDDMMITNDQGRCKLKRSPEMIPIDELPKQEHLQKVHFLGLWYQHASSERSAGIHSVMMNITERDDGAIMISMAAARDVLCLPVRTFVLLALNEMSDWSFRISRSRGRLRVLYNDNQNMILYFCTRIDMDGTCSKGHSSVTVSSRSESMKKRDLWSLRRYILDTGYNAKSLQATKHQVICDLTIKVSGCTLAEIPVMLNLDLQQFYGVWYPIWRITASSTRDSAIVRLSEGEADTIILEYGGSSKGICVPTSRVLLTTSRHINGDMIINYGTDTGHLKVIYTDYRHALLYECSQSDPEGRCLDSEINAEIWSRDGAIEPRLKFSLLKRLKKICVEPSRMEEVPRDEFCSLEQVRSCKVGDVKSQRDLDLDQFVGSWYVVGSLKSTAGFWDSRRVIFSKTADNTLAVHAVASRRGSCFTPSHTTWRRIAKAGGIFILDDNDRRAEVRVVTTNYNYAIIYECHKINRDGTCSSDFTFVDVLSRNLGNIPDILRHQFAALTRDLCLAETEMMEIKHDGTCDLSLLQPQCKVENIVEDVNLNPKWLPGQWRTVKYSGSSTQLDAIHYNITSQGHAVYSIKYTAMRNGRCLSSADMYSVLVSKQGVVGLYHVAYGKYRGILKILYASPDILVVYECYLVSRSGHCSPRHKYVEVLARPTVTEVPRDVMHIINQRLDAACLDHERLLDVKSEVTCGKEEIDPCLVPNYPTVRGFTKHKIIGTWYSIARWGHYREMDSLRAEIELIPRSRNIAIHYTGAINGECQKTNTITYELGEEDELWTSNIDSKARVVYLTYDHMVLYECSRLVEDKCPPEFTYLDIYSREIRAPDPASQATMIQVVVDMCMDIPEFVQARHTVSCPSSEMNQVLCTFDDLPAMEDLNINKLTGTWYALLRHSGSGIVDSGSIRISLMENGELSLLLAASSRGICIPAHTIIMRPYHNDDDYSDLLLDFNAGKGRVKVVHMDDNFMLIYTCMWLMTDGSCDPQYVLIDVLGRSLHIPDKPIGMMKGVSQKQCFKTDDFEVVQHTVDCPLNDPESNCSVNAVDTSDTTVSTDLLTGTWYFHYQSRNASPGLSGRIHLKVRQGNLHFEVAFVSNGVCSPSKTLILEKAAENGLTYKSSTGLLKILHVDRRLLILHNSPHVSESNERDTHVYSVSVLSRNKQPFSDDDIKLVRSSLRQVCLETGDLVEMQLTECNLSKIGCQLDEIPKQDSVDIRQLTGTWYSLAYLRYSYRCHSGIWRIKKDASGYKILVGCALMDQCVPNFELQVRVNSGSNVDLTLSAAGDKAQARILYTDYEYMLLYTCTKYSANTCSPGSDNVVLYGRYTDREYRKLEQIMQGISTLCIDTNDFEWISRRIDCPLPVEEPCVSNRLSIPDINPQKLLGLWYISYDLRGSGLWTSGKVEFTATKHNDVYMTASNGEYMETSLLMTTSKKGVWLLQAGLSKLRLSLLYIDDAMAVIYVCKHPTNVGSCQRDDIIIVILSRVMGQEVTDDVILALGATLRGTCIEIGDLSKKIEKDFCLAPRTSVPYCSQTTLRTTLTENIKPDKLSGTWFAVYQLKGKPTLNSAILRMKLLTNGSVVMSYTNSWLGSCMNVENTTVTLSSLLPPGNQTSLDYNNSVPLRFIYVDKWYANALTYGCVQHHDNVSCDPNMMTITVWSRSRMSSKNRLKEVLTESRILCYKEDHFTVIAQNEECYNKLINNTMCNVNEIKHGDDLKLDKLLGNWYGHFVLRRARNIHSVSAHFAKDVDDTIQGYISYYSNRHCYQHHIPDVTSSSNGTLIYKAGYISVLLKILYLDDSYIGLYLCDLKDVLDTEDGCIPSSVQIVMLSHNEDELSPERFVILYKMASEACEQPGDFIEIKYNPAACPVDVHEAIDCNVEDHLLIQQNFKINEFTGTWHVAAFTKGSSVSASLSFRITRNSGDLYQFQVTGLSAGRACYNSDLYNISHPGQNPGHMVIQDRSGLTNHLYVLYTNYKYAVVYTCISKHFQHCKSSTDVNILILSRISDAPPGVARLLEYVPNRDCVGEEDFVWITEPGQCEFPEDDIQCKVHNIPSVLDLDMDQLSGLWYGIYRVIRKDVWSSLVIYFKKIGPELFQLYYRGRSGDACIPPAVMEIVVNRGRNSVWAANYQALPMHIRIVYLDSEYLVLYTCMKIRADGSCDPDRRFLDILSRKPGIVEEDLREKLQFFVKRSCFEVGDLEQVQLGDFCELADTYRKYCGWSNLPLTHHIDSKRFQGSWYTYAVYKSSAEYDPVSLHIQQSADGKLHLLMANARGGKCLKPHRTALIPVTNQHDGDYAFADNAGAYLRVIYTDYTNALIAICSRLTRGGSCQASHLSVFLFTRDGVEPSEVMEHDIRIKATMACLDVNKRVVIQDIDCPLRNIRCDQDDIPQQEDFKLNWFQGSWYAVARLHRSFLSIPGIMDGRAINILPRSSFCVPSTDLCVRPVDGSISDLLIVKGSQKVKMRVMSTDYQNYAVVMVCDTEDDLVRCHTDTDNVIVLSRTRNMTESYLSRVLNDIDTDCYHHDGFEWITDEDACPHPIDHYQYCKIDNLHLASNVQLNQLSGKWFVLAEAQQKPGSWKSLVVYLDRMDNSSLTQTVSGLRNGFCLSTSNITLKSNDNPAEWSFKSPAGHLGVLKVLFYNQRYLVIYQCSHVTDEQTCSQSMDTIYTLSHSLAGVDIQEVMSLYDELDQQCLIFNDFHLITEQERCDLLTPPVLECNISSLPQQPDIDLDKISGTWYGLYYHHDQRLIIDHKLLIYSSSADKMVHLVMTSSDQYLCHPIIRIPISLTNNTNNETVFRGKYNDLHIEFKILWTDYEYFIGSLCSDVKSDDICEMSAVTVFMMGRQPESPVDSLVLTEALSESCLTLEDFVEMEHTSDCVIPPANYRCLVDNITALTDFTLDQIQETWYTWYRTRTATWQTGVISITTLLDTKALYSEAYSSDGICYRSQSVVVKHHTSLKRCYYSTGLQCVHVRILHLSEEYMIIYECTKLASEGYCHHGHDNVIVFGRQPPVHVDVMTRDSFPNEDIMTMIRTSVRKACFQPGDMVLADEIDENCKISERLDLPCHIGQLELENDLDVSKLTGTWYSQLKLRGSNVAESAVMYLAQHEQSGKTLNIRLRASRMGKCLEDIIEGQLNYHDNYVANMTTVIGGVKGRLLVLFTDYNNLMLTYQCHDEVSVNECQPGQETVVLYSRAQALTQDVQSRLLTVLQTSCFGHEHFEHVPHAENCLLDTRKDTSCKIRNLPLVANFDINKFLGTWYYLYRPRQNHTFTSLTSKYQLTPTGEVLMYYRGSQGDKCLETKSVMLAIDREASEWRLSDKHQQGTVRVVYTDYDYAVLYTCFHILDDGHCAPDSTFVGVLSRHKDELPADVQPVIAKTLNDICYQLGDFVVVDYYEFCEIYPQDNGYCSMDGTPVVSDFQPGRFSGWWYSYAELKGSSSLDANGLLVLNDGEELVVVSRGQRSGHCLSPITYKLKPVVNASVADFMTQSESVKSRLRVHFTDYSSALISLCHHMDEDGYCAGRYESVILYTRDGSLAKGTEQMMTQAQNTICLSDNDVVIAPQRGLKCEPKTIQCESQDLPAHEQLELNKLSGSWYKVAQLTGTAGWQWGDLRVYTENGIYMAAMTGVKSGVCQGTYISEVTRYLSSHTADLYLQQQRRQQQQELQGTLYLRVLYTDYDHYSLVYGCNKFDVHPTCIPGNDYVYVYSRTKAITERDLRQVISHVQEYCFTERQFELVRAANCEFTLERPQHCTIDQLPVDDHFDDNIFLITGSWYLSYTIRSLADSSQSTHIDIVSLEDRALLIASSYASDGTCSRTIYVVLLHTDVPGKYIAGMGNKQVIFHFTIIDDQLVVYKCIDVDLDGTCSRSSAQVDIYSRDAGQITPQSLSRIHHHIRQACFEPGDLSSVNHHVWCPLAFSQPFTCHVNELPTPKKVSLFDLSGTWYARYAMTGSNIPESGVMRIIYNTDNTITTYLTGVMRGWPGSTAAVTFTPEGTTGDLYVLSNGIFKGHMKILYTDKNNLLIYMCPSEDGSGICAPARVSIILYNRQKETTNKKLQGLIRALDNKCIPLENFQEISHNVSVTLDITQSDFCKIHNMPTVSHLDLNTVTGSWFNHYILQEDQHMAASLVYISEYDRDRLNITYVGYKAHNCLYQQTIAHHIPNQAALIFTNRHYQGIMKVIYQSHDYVMLYICHQTAENGFCKQRQTSVFILSQTTDAIDLQNESDIVTALRQVCLQPGDFIPVSHQENSVPCVSVPVSCDPDLLPTQQSFSLRQFTGTWYAVYKQRDHTTLNNIALKLTEHDGHMLDVSTVASRSGHCLSIIRGQYVMSESKQAAEMYVKFGSVKGSLRILYTDFDYALVLECFEELSNGSCIQGQSTLLLYGRSRSSVIPDHTRYKIDMVLMKSCLSINILEPVAHNMYCQFDEESVTDCHVRNIPYVQNFDMKKYLGTWYSLYRLRSPHSFKHFVASYYYGLDGKVKAIYSGVSNDNCTTLIDNDIQMTNDGSAIWQISRNDAVSTVKVLYTDYTDFSVIFTCTKIEMDGSCDRSHVFVDVMGREKFEPAEDVKNKLTEMVKWACYEPGDLVENDFNDQCDLHQQIKHNYSELPEPDTELDARQFEGIWYSYSSVYASMDTDAVTLVTRLNLQAGFSMLFFPQRNGQCMRRTAVTLLPCDGQRPWVYCSTDGGRLAIYMEGNMALTMQCQELGSDNVHCLSGYSVTVWSPTVDKVNDKDVQKVIQMVRSEHLTSEMFVRSVHLTDCDTRRVQCSVRDLPPQAGLDIRFFTGTWQISAVNRPMKLWKSRPIIHITQNDKGVYKMYFLRPLSKEQPCSTASAIGHKMEPLTDNNDQFIISRIGSSIRQYWRILWTDYEKALIFTCEINETQSCIPASDMASVFTRSQQITENDLQKILDKVKDQECFSLDEFHWVPQLLPCPLSSVIRSRSCDLDNLPVQEDLTPEQITGMWYVNYRHRNTPDRGSSLLKYKLLHNGNLRLFATGYLNGKCLPTTTVDYLNTSQHYHWKIKAAPLSNGYIRILYLDEEMAVMYKCVLDAKTGVCKPRSTFIDILGRGPDRLMGHNLDLMADILQKACFDPGDFVYVPHDDDCKATDPESIHCDLDHLPSQSDFIAQKFTGSWNAIYRTPGAGFGESSKFKFKANGDGTYTSLITSSRRGRCMATRTAKYTQKSVFTGSSSDLYGVTEKHKFWSRILYTDYLYTLMYTCKRLADDKTCLPGATVLTVYSRTHEVPDGILTLFLALVADSCTIKERIFEKLLIEDHCKVAEPERRRCQVNQLPVVDDFDILKFSGRWYSRFQLRRDVTSSVSSHQMLIDVVGDNNLLITHSYHNGRECHQVSDYLYASSTPGVYYYSVIGEDQSILKISHTDYGKYAMIYSCTQLSLTGSCTDGYQSVTFYSRTLNDIPQSEIVHLRLAAWSVCTEPGDYYNVTHEDSCQLVPPRPLRCSFDEMPHEKHFSLEKFTGTWYAVSRLTGTPVLDSFVMRIEHDKGQQWKLISAGLIDGHCIQQEDKVLTYSENGFINLQSKNTNTGGIKVLHTDYNTALFYICSEMMDSGHCIAGEESLVVYTRFWSQYIDVLDQLDQVTDNTCYRKSNMEPVSHDVTCQLPVPNSCLVRNIPTESNFNLEKFLGTWYSLYQLKAEQLTHGFTLYVDRGSDHIIRLYNTAASKHGCTKTNVREINEPQQHDVATWILDRYNSSGVFKIIMTDYYHSVTYKCRELAEDGTCKPGHEFVDIISRVREFPSEHIQQKLFKYMKMICKERGEFVRNDVNVVCPMSAKVTKQCNLDDMPVVENFNAKKFEGVWYVYAKLRTTSDYDYMTTIVKRGPSGALIALNHPVSQGKCMESFEKTLLPSGDQTVADFLQNGGHVRVVYTDYNYALLVGCHQLADDGTCVPGQSTAVVYSRTKHVPQTTRGLITEVASKCCLTETDLRITTAHVSCPVKYSGRHSCKFNDIITQENFTFNKMYGTWYLLANTGSDKNQPTIVKFMKGHNNLIRYAVAQTLRDGSCFTSIAFVKPDDNRQATYSYKLANRNAISRIIYLTSSYLVEYDCHGSLLDANGVCPPGREQIQIWGRSSFVTDSIVRQILNGIEYKTCLNVSEYTLTPTPEVLCKLPIETCNMYKFVEPEPYDINLVYGGWQLLSRTTLVPTKSISKSILFYSDTKTGEVRYADAGSLSSGACYSSSGVLVEDPDHKATYVIIHKNGETVITRILYVTKDHLIIMACNDKLDKHGVCYYGNSELNIFGKSLEFNDEIRKGLIRIAEERTLGCVPTVAMMDVPSNDNCQISADYCSSRHFSTPEHYDQRMLYGEWNIVMRTTFMPSPFISQRIIYSHGMANYMYYTTGILLNTGECIKSHGMLKIVSREMATYSLVDPSIVYDSKVLFVDSRHLVLYICINRWDSEQHCPLERTSVTVLSRDLELGAKDINRLQKIIRQQTLSCIPTSMFVTVRPTDCAIEPPLGHQSCALSDIKEVSNLDPEKLAGVWYQIAQSAFVTNRIDSKLSGVMMLIKVNNNKLLYKVTGYLSSQTKQCLPDTSFVTTFKPGKAGLQQYVHTRESGITSIMKILYVDANHFISYRCYNSTQLSDGMCPHKHEAVSIFSRRKRVNEVLKRHLVDLVIKHTCMMRDDLVINNNTAFCQLNAHAEGTQRLCIVDELPVQKDFKQDQFVGVWYEVERTRFTSDNVWESIVSHFSPVEKHYIRLTVSGTRGGKCMGPFEAHLSQLSSAGDMLMWLGSRDSYGHPWTINMKYKVIYTDYQTAIVYTCRHVNADGTCPKHSQQVDILSRQHDIDPAVRSRMHDIIREKLCLSPADFVIPANEGDCIEFVRPTSVDPENFAMFPGSSENKCPHLECSLYCEHGFDKDSRGCDVCQCMTGNSSQGRENNTVGSVLPGTPLCRVPICIIYCEHGYQKDKQGCDTCQCLEPNTPDSVPSSESRLQQVIPSHCPEHSCPLKCEHGYLRDNDGCLTCECKLRKKDIPRLERKLDDNKSSPQCATPMCSERCQHGYVYNEYGCMTCKCKESAPQVGDNKPEKIVNKTISHVCATPLCADKCEHGYVYDEFDCMTCECKEKPADVKQGIQCAIPMCANFCEYGYVHNSYGCMTCKCRDTPSEFDSMLLCRPIECALTCEQGFVKDSDGCDICKCATDTSHSENAASTEVSQSQSIRTSSPDVDQSSSVKTMSDDVDESDSIKTVPEEANQSESVITVNSETSSLMEEFSRYMKTVMRNFA